MGQVDFHTTDEVQKQWCGLKSEVDLKNDGLLAAMLAAYKESRGGARQRPQQEHEDG